MTVMAFIVYNYSIFVIGGTESLKTYLHCMARGLLRGKKDKDDRLKS